MNQLGWAVVGAAFTVDVLIFWVSNFSLLAKGELQVLACAALFLSIWLVYSRRRPAPRLAHTAHSALPLLMLTNSLGLLSYLLTGTLDAPLLDHVFAGIDKRLGLDWLAVHEFLNSSPTTAFASSFIYLCSGPQIILLVLGLNLAARYERSDELLAGFAICGLLMVVIGAWLPAAGAFHWYAVPEAANTQYLAQYMAIRDGSLRAIDLHHMQGIVQFPSFHTALSCLYIYVTRGLRGIFPAVLLFNLALIAVTPSAGGHHFVDVLAGLSLTVAVICFIRWVASRDLRNLADVELDTSYVA